MRDWRQSRDNPYKEKSEQFKTDLRKLIEGFMDGHYEDKTKEEKKRLCSDFVATKLNLFALDHGLSTCQNRSLAEFVSANPLRPLAVGEKRYFVEAEDLDEEDIRDNCLRRACSEQIPTGARHFELPNEELDEDSLFLWADQCTYDFLWIASVQIQRCSGPTNFRKYIFQM